MSRHMVYFLEHPQYFGELPKKMDIQEFFINYKPVEILQADSLEEVYSRMQGENWSPNGEMRDFILAQGINHTSMSIGDVVYSQEDDKFYMVDRFGFEELILK